MPDYAQHYNDIQLINFCGYSLTKSAWLKKKSYSWLIYISECNMLPTLEKQAILWHGCYSGVSGWLSRYKWKMQSHALRHRSKQQQFAQFAMH